MSSRKQLIIAIESLDRQLWSQQNQLNEHKHYFKSLLQNSWVMLPVILLPAFFAGWNSGRVPVRKFRRFGKFVLLSTVTHLQGI